MCQSYIFSEGILCVVIVKWPFLCNGFTLVFEFLEPSLQHGEELGTSVLKLPVFNQQVKFLAINI